MGFTPTAAAGFGAEPHLNEGNTVMDKEKKDESEEIITEEVVTEEQNELPQEEQECEILDAVPTDSKYNEMLDKYQRSVAEFDNYRKRTIKEMAARYDDGIRFVAEKLLPMVDNFERALSANEDIESSFYQGVAMIARQYGGILEDMGVKPIALEPGDTFDPNFHNAVAHVEDENFGQNSVAEVLQKGYMYKDKVLRYSMVKVAN